MFVRRPIAICWIGNLEANFLSLPLCNISLFSSGVIQGEEIPFTLFSFSGACLSAMSKNICCHISQAVSGLCSCSIRCHGTIDKSVRKLSGIKFLKHLLVTVFGFDLGIQIFLIAYTRQWSLIPISTTPESEKFHGWLVKNKLIIDDVNCYTCWLVN